MYVLFCFCFLFVSLFLAWLFFVCSLVLLDQHVERKKQENKVAVLNANKNANKPNMEDTETRERGKKERRRNAGHATKEGRKEGRKEGGREGRREGRKEGSSNDNLPHQS